MFNTDKPIKHIKEDKLGRSSFANQLANAIMNYSTTDNYAISLQGRWGCGKTSILNMAMEEITLLSESMDEKNRITMIEFNPWNFTDTNQLINQFFVTLTNSLTLDNKEDKIKNVGAAIEEYSSALEYSEYIPVVGKYLKIFPKLLSKFGKSMKEQSEKKLNDVSYRKSEVENALRKLDSRILIIIDDIDRLPNDQIRLIFQLVCSVAGLPNITYLLSFDKDIVARALSDVQLCDGEEYLEKIIQVPFDVPPLDISKVHNILFEKLNNLIDSPKSVKFDQNHWSSVFNSCVSPFIKSLRDVNRFYNTLSFTYASVKEEVNFIDMAGISALQNFAKPIYEWIRDNKFSLIGGYDGKGVSMNEIDKRKSETIENFAEIYPQSPEIMLSAVASLFPKLSNQISYSSNFKTNSEVHQTMRIASGSKFDLYFSLSLDSIKISRKELDDSLLNMEVSELRSYIKLLNERELVGSYLSELELSLSRIPENRIELILNALVFENGEIIEEKNSFFGPDSTVLSIYTVRDMLFRVNDENHRYSIIEKMFTNSDFLSFQSLLHLLHIIELTHGRIAKTEHINDDKLITLEQLYKLEKTFLQRTKCFLRTSNLLDWEEARRVSFLWDFIEEESYRDYMIKALKTDISIPKYISIKAAKWYSGQIYSYDFSDKSYQDYVDDIQIIDVINKLRMKEVFWNLDKEVVEASVAFILRHQEPSSGYQVHLSDINNLIDTWKIEFKKQNK